MTINMSTKEKRSKKEKSVNNQNNSIELFPVINTNDYDDEIKLRFD